MKLPIYTFENGYLEHTQVWKNFRKYVDDSYNSTVLTKTEFKRQLLADYSAKLTVSHDADSLLFFDNEEMLSLFLLRFS